MKPKEPIRETEYVLGLVFSKKTNRSIVLLSKLRPEWQLGKLNGPGGRVQPGETPGAAMVREFGEECGAYTVESDWEKIALLVGKKHYVHVFKHTIDPDRVSTMADEVVSIYDWAANLDRMVLHMDWLIPLALSGTVKLPLTIEVTA